MKRLTLLFILISSCAYGQTYDNWYRTNGYVETNWDASGDPHDFRITDATGHGSQWLDYNATSRNWVFSRRLKVLGTIGCSDPVAATHVVTKGYADLNYGGGAFLPVAGGTMTGDWGMNQGTKFYLNSATDTAYFRYILNGAYGISPKDWIFDIGSAAGTRKFAITSGGSDRVTINDLGVGVFDGNVTAYGGFNTTTGNISTVSGAVISASQSVQNASISNNLTVGHDLTVSELHATNAEVLEDINLDGDVYSNTDGVVNFAHNIDVPFITATGITVSDTAKSATLEVSSIPTDSSSVVRLQELEDRALIPYVFTSSASFGAPPETDIRINYAGGASEGKGVPFAGEIVKVSVSLGLYCSVGSATFYCKLNGTAKTGANDPIVIIDTTNNQYEHDDAVTPISFAADSYIEAEYDTHSTFNTQFGYSNCKREITVWIRCTE